MRGTKRMRMVAEIGSRQLTGPEATAVILEASRSFRERQAERMISRMARLPEAPDRRSVSIAMLAVEIRLVKAFWTIARLPAGKITPLGSRRNGVDYLHDADDQHARYADAAGGKWEAEAPRPSLPSAKDIDDANAALDWLLLVDSEALRKILVVGATSKRGDAGRRINWLRLREGLPEFADMTIRTLQRRYQDALRTIVSELTIARLSSLSHKRG